MGIIQAFWGFVFGLAVAGRHIPYQKLPIPVSLIRVCESSILPMLESDGRIEAEIVSQRSANVPVARVVQRDQQIIQPDERMVRSLMEMGFSRTVRDLILDFELCLFLASGTSVADCKK